MFLENDFDISGMCCMDMANNIIQCTLDISRLAGYTQWYLDISDNAIYRATITSHNPGSIVQRVVSDNGAYVLVLMYSAVRISTSKIIR